MKTLLGLLVLGIMLSGCATPYDVDIAQSNNATVQNHDTRQGEVAAVKARSISSIFDKISQKCEGQDSFACGALLGLSGAMASRDIAGIETKEYKGPTQKTGVDVQYHTVDAVREGIPIAGMAVVSYKAIDQDKGVVSNTAQEGSTVNNTYDEDHAVSTSGYGDTSSTNTPSGNHEEVVAPEEPIVE